MNAAFPLFAANDPMPRLSFQEMLDYIEVDPECKYLVVPESTYPSGRISERPYIARGVKAQEGEWPVFMRGSWETIANKYETYISFIFAVVRRYLSIHKVTILSRKDAHRVERRLHRLIMSSEKKKRRGAYRTNRFEDVRSLLYLPEIYGVELWIKVKGWVFRQKCCPLSKA